MFDVLVFILFINFPTDEYFDKYSKTKNGDKSYLKLVTIFSLTMEVKGGLISESFSPLSQSYTGGPLITLCFEILQKQPCKQKTL